jgi:hypothetical protein
VGQEEFDPADTLPGASNMPPLTAIIPPGAHKAIVSAENDGSASKEIHFRGQLEQRRLNYSPTN